jgi:glycosyltransferase involved in cell wall biosynthesis
MSDGEIARLKAELARLQGQQQRVRADTEAIVAEIDAIHASLAWRALTAYRTARARLGMSGGSGPALRAMLRARRGARGVARAVTTAPLGVNVAGYLEAESGMGEAARASIRSLEAAGVPLALNNVPSRQRAQDTTYRGRFAAANPHPFNLVHLNADNMGWFASERGLKYFRRRYTIGFWFWELSAFRDEWLPFFGYVDEVWAATEFVRAAVQARTALPVVRMPLPVTLPSVPAHGRAHFGLPERGAVFLYAFDVSSQTERKNPVGAIRAFRRAGLPHAGAVLVLKFTNAGFDREAVRRLHAEADGLNVVMLEGHMDREELAALIDTADCYFSPHRAEGFGLTLLEAMALGKPVIATNYSGNVDFMTADNSYPIDYRMAALTRDYGPYMRGAEWAEPDLDHAARLIRQVVEQPADARARGARARADVARDWTPAVTGPRMRQRLERIRSGHVTP